MGRGSSLTFGKKMRLYLIILSLMLITGCNTGSGDVKVIDRSGSGSVTRSGIELIPIKKVAPSYPADARKARLEGVVQVQFTVKPDGSVSDLIIVRSAHPVLDQLVLDAVAQWKFQPYTPRDGKLEKLQIPFTFSTAR